MLVMREVEGSLQTIARIKRKVRLASGLDSNDKLSEEEAMARGWQCLTLFAERLQDIPPSQIRIVATATLRLATMHPNFLKKQHLFSARLWQRPSPSSRGILAGASTELVTGKGSETTALFSLNMAVDRRLTKDNFFLAEQAAVAIISPVSQEISATWLESVCRCIRVPNSDISKIVTIQQPLQHQFMVDTYQANRVEKLAAGLFSLK
ncbi:unnamed protein product [Ranitomeya imitator]|uniref:Ppx/GppA phosphatase N-terminal domain-containing protein n=1 Tax=Ranitomeya imitator TaxID=111125 RepID=A0ABN9MIY7_9NEOB|nr:unnamed protein product [Ranitomeya imitator]